MYLFLSKRRKIALNGPTYPAGKRTDAMKPGRLSFTWIGHEVLLAGGAADGTVGAKVGTAPRVTIVTGSHELFTDPDKAAGLGYSAPILIEAGVWLGAASVILGGVTVGRRSVVAAGALVNRDVAAESVVGGVPARPIPQMNVRGAS